MYTRDGIFKVCCSGIYSCYWKGLKERNPGCKGFWFTFHFLMSILTLGWIYICFVAYNDHNDVNWKAFNILGVWIHWYMAVIILSAVLAIYCLLLVVFALVLFSMKEPLDLHCIHKFLLFVGLIIVGFGVAGISIEWREEWNTIHMSLQATAPFLQLAAVAALTVISWFVFEKFFRAQTTVCKVFIIGTLVAVAALIFLSPLKIYSPCITDNLPPKPALVAHRGAPLLAPENTLMSFERSIECKVAAFETDVQLSKDNVSFLMHDHGKEFLKRTTNVAAVFPNRKYDTSHDFTWEELQGLNAGEWFVKTNPFWSVSSLSKEQKELAREQRIASLAELLELGKKHNISVIFDIKNEEDDCEHIVTTVLKSNIPHNLIWWLPSRCRDTGFRQVYDKPLNESVSGDFLNLKYSASSTKEISKSREKDISVNLWVVNERWLFSLLWCSGASSVTTNTCHLLKDMSRPDWHLAPYVYRIIWITADVVSFFVTVILFFLQKRRNTRRSISSWSQLGLYYRPHLIT
ncbi:glycerophosphoinositol inositolphosphodiesterase GDPD2 [Trichomycterus rosablanca]|uniref:glycerophosphoinositol inositolphosphodiesterase GDPD2 n=1 Tax=Trichomycterus rosablanca TaxID=2290929 RepID=UPI002F36010C